jgi:hypothetical protein
LPGAHRVRRRDTDRRSGIDRWQRGRVLWRLPVEARTSAAGGRSPGLVAGTVNRTVAIGRRRPGIGPPAIVGGARLTAQQAGRQRIGIRGQTATPPPWSFTIPAGTSGRSRLDQLPLVVAAI